LSVEEVIGERLPDTSLVVGDDPGFGEIYAACADVIFTFVRRRVSADEAEDVVADVFLVAWRRREEIPAEPLPWLLGVARRVLANHRRSDERADALVDRLRHEAEVGAATQSPSELDLQALRALGSLPKSDQEILLLAAWEGLNRGELAAVLGITAPTTTVRLFRAKRRFARALMRLNTEPLAVEARASSMEVL
jgi:RNA polymerase sigma-70 factor (ECF subfamily)